MHKDTLLLACLLAAPALGQDPKARASALRKSELKRLEVELAAPGETKLLRAIRIERISEIQTFLEHVEGAALKRVLILSEPAPEIARISVTPISGNGFVVGITKRAFRVLESESAAFIFQSPALLRWIEDRLEMPHYDLREKQEPDLAKLLDGFRKNTNKLTREQQEDAPEGQHPTVLNGDFEKTEGWDRVDGLTTFWIRDPFENHGRVLKMDTDVLESEWLKRKQELATNPSAKPWPKTLVGEQRQYATVGATYGVSFYSAPMEVRKGQAYRIDVDFRAVAASGGISKIWVRGYGRLEVRGKQEWRRVYDSLHTLRTNDPRWHSYTNVFHPTKNTPSVVRVRVMLYSYWPRGEYRWDNVRIVAISDEEYRKAKATERSDVK